MSTNGFTTGQGRRQEAPDKVDMSLDDIIRLNKEEQQLQRRQATVKKKGRPIQGKGLQTRTAGPVQRGGGVQRGAAHKLRNRRIPPLLKRMGQLNRAAISQKTRQNTRPFIQRSGSQYRKPEVQRRPYRQTDTLRGQAATSVRSPFQLQRRPLPPVLQTQRESRQAMFLVHRGIKVQAQVQMPHSHTPPVRACQWRTQASNSGIVAVTIDNQTARTQPEPPFAWIPHPPVASPAPVKVETVEKKIPKGVPLQFNINSVGKTQTSITLNQRFSILKAMKAEAREKENTQNPYAFARVWRSNS